MNLKTLSAFSLAVFSYTSAAAPSDMNLLAARSDDSCINIDHLTENLQGIIKDLKTIKDGCDKILDAIVNYNPADGFSDELSTIIVEVTHQIGSVLDALSPQILKCISGQILFDFVDAINLIFSSVLQIAGALMSFFASGFKLGSLLQPMINLVNVISQFVEKVANQIPLFGGFNKELVESVRKALNILLSELKQST